MKPESENNETAPAVTGTASEPKNPTVEVKPQESYPSIGAPIKESKPDEEKAPGRAIGTGMQSGTARAESDALVERMKAEYEAERPLREAMSHFSADDRLMLSDKGEYPVRFAIEPDYWGYVARHDLQVSPWLSDWENALERAGWWILRKRENVEVESSSINESCWAYPEDADLFCPRRNIYLALLPSKVSALGELVSAVVELCRGYPGSFAIMRARSRVKHLFAPRDDDYIRNLLSAKSTALCIELKAVVEFEGMLYEPDGPADDSGESTWHESNNIVAWQVYYEYRRNSLYYHADQEEADARDARIAKMEKEAEEMRIAAIR